MIMEIELIRQEELEQELLKDKNTRSLSEKEIQTVIKHLDEAVLWLLEHYKDD
jgi:hypothetical protein